MGPQLCHPCLFWGCVLVRYFLRSQLQTSHCLPLPVTLSTWLFSHSSRTSVEQAQPKHSQYHGPCVDGENSAQYPETPPFQYLPPMGFR